MGTPSYTAVFCHSCFYLLQVNLSPLYPIIIQNLQIVKHFRQIPSIYVENSSFQRIFHFFHAIQTAGATRLCHSHEDPPFYAESQDGSNGGRKLCEEAERDCGIFKGTQGRRGSYYDNRKYDFLWLEIASGMQKSKRRPAPDRLILTILIYVCPQF